ncbi:MAG: VWA domain-containing protein, partial [Phycisphaerales bacterium]|nr:VWA domain-containing protein [Phycisphaerales bacterium]
VRDPALLEYAGWNLLRSSVFPVEPHGSQHIHIALDHLLEVDGERLDLMLPRSESQGRRAPWSVQVDVSQTDGVADAWSPTHPIAVQRLSRERVVVSMQEKAETIPGPFRLSILRAEREPGPGVVATVLASPDPAVGGGQFLVLASLDPAWAGSGGPERDGSDRNGAERREVTLVVDCSGSMAGAKFDQARDAARRIVASLDANDRFNLLAYANGVQKLFEMPAATTPEHREAARRFIEGLRPVGGTNLHDAVVEALRQPGPDADRRDVLLLTDGLPTVGRTSERTIRAAAEHGNAFGRRIHSIGVGSDVNVPLLDRVADGSRGSATYLPATGAIADTLDRLADRLARPALAEVVFEPAGADASAFAEWLPALIPDLRAGEELVLVGRYLDVKHPLKATLKGTLQGRPVSIPVVVDPAAASVQHAFVTRLWASRRVAELIDQIRQAVPDGRIEGALHDDPRFTGLIDQIVGISTQYGILTEYTAFLATEGTRLDRPRDIAAQCGEQLKGLAVEQRWGNAAVAQGINYNDRKVQQTLNLDNRFVDQDLNEAAIAGVCQVADRGLFKRGDTWIDGRLVSDYGTLVPARTIDFGSDAHRALLERLCRENRQVLLSLEGNVLLEIDGEAVLVRNDC